MIAPDDFSDAFRWTSDAEAAAIRAEHDRRKYMNEPWREGRQQEDRRQARDARIANGVAAALVALFLLLCVLWGA